MYIKTDEAVVVMLNGARLHPSQYRIDRTMRLDGDEPPVMVICRVGVGSTLEVRLPDRAPRSFSWERFYHHGKRRWRKRNGAYHPRDYAQRPRDGASRMRTELEKAVEERKAVRDALAEEHVRQEKLRKEREKLQQVFSDRKSKAAWDF